MGVTDGGKCGGGDGDVYVKLARTLSQTSTFTRMLNTRGVRE